MNRMLRSLAFVAGSSVLVFVGGSVGDVQAQRATPATQAAPAAAASIDQAVLKAYEWRSIGPARGGRSIAVSGVKGHPDEAYFGATGGGLWKTSDAGQTWAPVTDGQLKSSSVGAVAVSESNPDIVYIGMGESAIRGNILPGDGVYKSTDAGKTWTHVGFSNSDAISKIRIDPTNPDIVFVADFGRYGVPSAERGVFKTTDGGKTWKKVLFRDDKTGAVDIAIDHNHPNVMYAALWEAYRVEYKMSSGGPGSGLFKSTDGGDTWKEITRNPGLPAKGPVGKIGVAVSGGDSNRVYALIEHADGGLFTSDDAGATWKLVNSDRRIRQRAFYYTHLYADPVAKDTVYMLNTSAFRSIDGGKTLKSIGKGTHGDHHDLWIDPDNTQHLVLGNDGGGAVTVDGGKHWSEQDFATAQFYHVITDAHVPYRVCGSQQDNSTMCVPSDIGPGGVGVNGGGSYGRIPPVAPYEVGGGEPGYIAPDPTNPDVYFAGTNNGSFITRYDMRSGALKEVGAYPRFFSGEASNEVKERWQWTFPIIFSPIDPKILYTSSQHVWKTTDGGQNWERISGDLTRHEPKTMGVSGGPITHDMNSPEIYATVFALAPGKTDVNVIWAGSDDGLVHVTRDGGKTWANVTPKDMPDLGRVSQIDASKFDAGTAYVAVKRPLFDDFTPYIFRTHDFGKTWTKTVSGIAANDYVHVVREDPTRKGLLYAGTEHGFYISYDDGDHWQSLRLNLPDTQVSDIWLHGNDMAISTMGRGFYILDDIGALRQYGPAAVGATDAWLFKPGDAIHSAEPATIEYWLKQPAKSMTLDILDATGKVIRSYKGVTPKAKADEDDEEEGPRGGPAGPSMAAGLNRFAWDLRYEGAVKFPGMVLWGATTNGPMALPGTYQVRMTVDGKTLTEPVTIVKHPLRDTPTADLQKQLDMAMAIRDKVSEANEAVIKIRQIKKDVADRVAKKSDGKLRAAADRLTGNLTAVEEAIYQVRNRSNQDPLNFPIKINNRLASLLRVVETGDGVPTSNVGPIFVDVQAELKVQTDKLQQTLATDLPAFNQQAERAGLDPVKD
jgi:photosystem II stability/assembly factor-like uncharacterized protein